jgi:hypothetical protein
MAGGRGGHPLIALDMQAHLTGGLDAVPTGSIPGSHRHWPPA